MRVLLQLASGFRWPGSLVHIIRVGFMATPPPPAPTVSVAEYLGRVLSGVKVGDPVEVPLSEALGRTLARDTLALVDVPNFDNSAMDGYAVRIADTASATADAPVILSVIADLPAGSALNPPIGAGQAARIMTGAPMPDAADCVVPAEDVVTAEDVAPAEEVIPAEDVVPIEETDQASVHAPGRTPGSLDGTNSPDGPGQISTTIRVLFAPKPEAHIRRTGSDARIGDTVLSAGRTLNARDLAAASATGSSTLAVVPAPRVGVLSTGSELRKPGETLGRGQIYDSNSLLLAASVSECGAIPVLIGSVPDDEASLRAIFEEYAPRVDAFVTSGGVSVGAYDVVKAVLAPLGVWFGPVRMQPGKPQGFGHWPGADGPGTPIFALPGNPVSVFVSFEQFVRPALLAMQGRSELVRPIVRATVSGGWRSPAARAQFMPARADQAADGTWTVRPASAGGAGSYLVASLAGANALVAVPESVTEVLEGDLVDVTLVP